jgi:hypothetical protein
MATKNQVDISRSYSSCNNISTHFIHLSVPNTCTLLNIILRHSQFIPLCHCRTKKKGKNTNCSRGFYVNIPTRDYIFLTTVYYPLALRVQHREFLAFWLKRTNYKNTKMLNESGDILKLLLRCDSKWRGSVGLYVPYSVPLARNMTGS